MRIILTAVDQPLADAWQRYCGDVEGVTIHHGSIFDVHCEALVSPANSLRSDLFRHRRRAQG